MKAVVYDKGNSPQTLVFRDVETPVPNDNETGRIRSVIDRRYPLSETAEAVRYLSKGHVRGKVIITCC